MPDIDGQTFPDYVHTEFPKLLYKDGAAYTEAGGAVHPSLTLSVANAEEEAEANKDGYGVALAKPIGHALPVAEPSAAPVAQPATPAPPTPTPAP